MFCTLYIGTSNCSRIENFRTNITRMDKHVQGVRTEQFSLRLNFLFQYYLLWRAILRWFFILKIKFEGQIFGTSKKMLIFRQNVIFLTHSVVELKAYCVEATESYPVWLILTRAINFSGNRIRIIRVHQGIHHSAYYSSDQFSR